MKTVIGIIGAPGTGKSTLMKQWMERWDWEYHRTGQLDHYVSGDLIVLGVYPEGETFGGTDKLSMSIAPQVVEFLDSNQDKVILFEGDRLNSKKFFHQVLEKGWNLRIVALDVPKEERERRYAERGSEQDPTWLQGRISKVENVIEEFGPKTTLFGEEDGHVVSFTHHSPVCTDVVSDWIQEEIDNIILDSVISDI
jgi:Cdc6-like AAA superfamily ATPase